MPIITSQSLQKGKPQTQLDWTGAPIAEGGAYGGRPEHMRPADKMAAVRAKIQPMTEERLTALRAGMAKARQALERKRIRRRLAKQKREQDTP